LTNAVAIVQEDPG